MGGRRATVRTCHLQLVIVKTQARSKVEAKAFIAYRMRRSFGITAIRAFAMVKRECLGIVLGNGTSGAARRKSANFFAKEMRQEYYNWCYGGRFD